MSKYAKDQERLDDLVVARLSLAELRDTLVVREKAQTDAAFDVQVIKKRIQHYESEISRLNAERLEALI